MLNKKLVGILVVSLIGLGALAGLNTADAGYAHIEDLDNPTPEYDFSVSGIPFRINVGYYGHTWIKERRKRLGRYQIRAGSSCYRGTRVRYMDSEWMDGTRLWWTVTPSCPSGYGLEYGDGEVITY